MPQSPTREHDTRPLHVRLRHRLEYAAIRGLTAVLRALGPDRAATLCGRVWRAVAPRTYRHRRALDNLARAFPEKSAAERNAIARAMWENLGRVMAELLLLDIIVGEGRRVHADAGTAAALQVGDGRGVYASCHYGNWELVAWPLTAAGHRTAAVYRPLDNPLLDAHVAGLRRHVMVAGLFAKSTDAPRRLLAHARAGHPICMLADLREAHHGIEVPFFGRPAPSTTLPAFLARALDLPLIAGRTVREGGGRFRIETTPVLVPRTDDRKADIRAATAALQAVFEGWIRDDPSQWMWAHRRWRGAPEPDGPPQR
jgi:KDO2-lipid IV(A) lauroyltransferase